MSGPAAKVCIKCGQDCSSRARSKDARGRYICQECVTKSRPAAPVSTPAAVPAEDESIYALDDAALTAATAAASRAERPRSCANCGMVMGAGAVVCTRCGLNTSTGKMLATSKRAGAGQKCLKCGFSLEGLPTPVCPECGTINTKEDRRAAARRKDARDSARAEYTRPMLMFGIGLALAVLLNAVTPDGNFTGAILWYLIKYAIYVPSGVIVFLLCCLGWLGFDAPIHLIALRLAGVYAVTDAVAAAMAFIPIPILPGLAVLITYVGLLQTALDLDLQDAIIVGLLTFAARFFAIMAVVTFILNR